MSTAMEVENAEAESSPLDLSVKKSIPEPAEAAEPAECDEPQPEEASLPDEDRKPIPLDLSPARSVSPPSAIDSEPLAQRASVVVQPPCKPAAPATAKDTYQVPVVSPLIADHVSPNSHVAAVPDQYQHVFAAEYNPYYAAAAAAAVAAATSAAKPALPIPTLLPPITAQFHHHHHHHQQQIQQQQIQLQQQQQQLQLQIQQQLQQQQQHLSTYGGHAYDMNVPMMTKPPMTSPLYVATASPPPSEFGSYPFGSYECLPKTASYGYGYPTYFDGMFGKGGAGDYGCYAGGMDGSTGSDSSGSRSDDCMSPDSEIIEHYLNMYSMGNPDVHPDDVAAIYRQSDFVSFRNRYLESLGPPKNFEKMRRSIPNKLLGGHMFDQTYVMKRQKNNEAAKRSRDAKRQKYIENQISVMYLTKKVSEMKEIKRRLLMSM